MYTTGFLAWIVPVTEPPSGGTPPSQPPGIWPPGYPAHPIAPGGPPPGIWPPGYPAHPIAPGGPPPGIWPSPDYPAHPIVIPPLPPSIWPSPGFPAHPIVLPPGSTIPPGISIWPPGPGIDVPAHPIVVPPDKVSTLIYIPGFGYAMVITDKPLPPGYNPPAGGSTPAPNVAP